MPDLNKRAKTVEAELQSLETGAMDEAKYLQLAENLSAFRKKLHARAKTLDISDGTWRMVRLCVSTKNSLTSKPQNFVAFHEHPTSSRGHAAFSGMRLDFPQAASFRFVHCSGLERLKFCLHRFCSLIQVRHSFT